jgi:hypothetical protein
MEGDDVAPRKLLARLLHKSPKQQTLCDAVGAIQVESVGIMGIVASPRQEGYHSTSLCSYVSCMVRVGRPAETCPSHYTACHNCRLKSVSLLGRDSVPITESWWSSSVDSTWMFVSVTMLMPSGRCGLMKESCEPVRVGLFSVIEACCFERSVLRPRRVSTKRDILLLPPTMVTVRAVDATASLLGMDERP